MLDIGQSSGMLPMTMVNKWVLVSTYIRYKRVNTLALRRWYCWN